MSIANKNQFWNTRMNGEDPTSLTTSDAFSGSGGSASDGSWVITNSTYSITPTTSEYSMLVGFKYNTIPDDNAVLMKLDNGTHKVEIKSDGTTTGLKMVGATTVTFSNLDLNLSDLESKMLILRLTLDANGKAKLYRDEIINNNSFVQDYLEITGASGSGKSIQFGNTSGSVAWGSVYLSTFGAFSPVELMRSDFAQDVHVRMALAIVQQLQNSERFYLKTHVDNDSIRYGYDLSPDTLVKMQNPSIHIILSQNASPDFVALGGSSVEQTYSVDVYVSTDDINYENAFLLCMNIMGEVFDELYTNTGLNATTDTIESYTSDLDYKTMNEEMVCTHKMTFTYKRRIKMTRR